MARDERVVVERVGPQRAHDSAPNRALERAAEDSATRVTTDVSTALRMSATVATTVPAAVAAAMTVLSRCTAYREQACREQRGERRCGASIPHEPTLHRWLRPLVDLYNMAYYAR